MYLYVFRYSTMLVGAAAEHYDQATSLARLEIAEHLRISPSLIVLADRAIAAEAAKMLQEVVRLHRISEDTAQLLTTTVAAKELWIDAANRFADLTHHNARPMLWLYTQITLPDDQQPGVLFASFH